MDKVSTCLWFENQAEEAAKFYTSLIKDSKITSISRNMEGSPAGSAGTVLTVSFQLGGRDFMALNGGPEFHFTEAISLSVDCDSQAEVDELWSKLTANGGEESYCGWLKDRYGLSWQIVPRRLTELLNDKDGARAKRVMDAMLKMRKIEVSVLEAA